MKKQLLILMTLFIAVIGYSQTVGDTFIVNNITYEITSLTPNRVEVIGYNINGGIDVVIPSSVTPNASGRTSSSDAANNRMMTYVVTRIDNLAFITDGIASVFIPNTITVIGDSAFGGNDLTSVTIPDSVTSIGSLAFTDNDLTSVILGNGLTSIGSNAFDLNFSLTCVSSQATTPPTIFTGNGDTFGIRSNIDLLIPTGTTSVYTAAQWTGFKSVSEPLSLNDTFVVDNITYQITSTVNNEVTVTNYNTAGGTVVNIPATVSSACTTFSVTNIGTNAFLSKNLTSVTIPNTVISIEEGAFNNNSINNLILGNNVEIIGNWAFQYNALTSVTIPDSVTTISFRAFNNNSIINLSLGNNVETIGAYAFANSAIASIIIPDSVLSIGDFAFTNNSALSNLVIGNSVVSIGNDAFISLIAPITSIIIPNSVTTIGDSAFYLTSLTDVFSESTTPPTITTGTNDTFGGVANRSTIHLHIPPNTTDAYVNDIGALWTGFNPVTEDALLSTTDFELTNEVKVITTIGGLEVVSNNGIELENYTIYSITGAKITSGKERTIKTTTLSNGIYVLKLDFDMGTVIKKVVIN